MPVGLPTTNTPEPKGIYMNKKATIATKELPNSDQRAAQERPKAARALQKSANRSQTQHFSLFFIGFTDVSCKPYFSKT